MDSCSLSSDNRPVPVSAANFCICKGVLRWSSESGEQNPAQNYKHGGEARGVTHLGNVVFKDGNRPDLSTHSGGRKSVGSRDWARGDGRAMAKDESPSNVHIVNACPI